MMEVMTNAQFFTGLAAVLVLGSGAAVLKWEFVREMAHSFDREVRQEDRKAEPSCSCWRHADAGL
jgi:hypothetical protein